MVRTYGAKDKVRRKYINSFSRQYINDLGIKMFKGDEQILTPVGKLYDIKLPNTRYYIGQEIIDRPDEIKKYTSYEQIMNLGYCIVSVNIAPEERWDMGQKVKYVLRRVTESSSHLGKMPKEHHIEYSPKQRAGQLVGPRAGPNGFGEVVLQEKFVKGNENSGKKANIYNYGAHADKYAEKQMQKWLGQEENPVPVFIKEAAFMITESNEIVCFPVSNDMPSILIAGLKGSGKCLIQDNRDDYILDGSGCFIKIKDKPKDAWCIDKDLKLKKTKILEYHEREVNKALKIKTRKGRELIVTHEHPLLTINGWKDASEFKKGDFIAIPKKYTLGLKKTLPIWELDFLAYMLARGKFKDKLKFKYVGKDLDILLPFMKSLKFIDKNLKLESTHIITNNKKNRAIDYLEQKELYGLDDTELFIPNCIMELRKDNILHFLNTYYSCKGFITKKRGVVFPCKSNIIAKQIQHLLLRFEIDSYIEKYVWRNTYTSWYVNIKSVEDIDAIKEILTPNNSYKIKKLKEFEPTPSKNRSQRYGPIPKGIFEYITESELENMYKGLGYKSQFKHNLSRYNLKRILRYCNNPFLKKIHNSDLMWDKIISIKEINGNLKAYDITVEDDAHNFVANDIVVHNSYCMHSIVSRLFWKPAYDYKITILNDSSRETLTWTLPNQDKNQINILKRLNERPLPLPCVFLHPLVKEDYTKLQMGNVGFDVTIPFKEVIDKSSEYFNLKETARYFTKIREDLKKCNTEDQVNVIFDELSFHYKIPVQSANKLRAEFETIFDAKMTDISTKGQDPWSTSKNPNKVYNPLTACMHAGVLPVLETEYISNDPKMLQIYFTYFVKDLFMRQKQDEDFLAEQSELLFVVDEAHNISQKAVRSGADMLLRRSVREGRPRRIGTLLATQKFKELPDVIKDNTTFLICFKNPGEATDIANQYNMGKNVANTIKDLEKHQCIAYTTEHFVVYDMQGKKRKSKMNEVFVGKTLPPYSMHKRPKKSED